MNINAEIIHRKDHSVIISDKVTILYSRPAKVIRCYFNQRIEPPMLDDLERSGILEVISANLSVGLVLIRPKSFYDHEKMTDLLTFVFEKYMI